MGKKKKYTKEESCNWLTMPEAVETFNLSASMLEKIAAKCGAKLKIGRAARYRRDILEEYINSLKA